MFKYSEKVGENLVTYEADTAQGIADLVNTMNSNDKVTPMTTASNMAVDTIIGKL